MAKGKGKKRCRPGDLSRKDLSTLEGQLRREMSVGVGMAMKAQMAGTKKAIEQGIKKAIPEIKKVAGVAPRPGKTGRKKRPSAAQSSFALGGAATGGAVAVRAHTRSVKAAAKKEIAATKKEAKKEIAAVKKQAEKAIKTVTAKAARSRSARNPVATDTGAKHGPFRKKAKTAKRGASKFAKRSRSKGKKGVSARGQKQRAKYALAKSTGAMGAMSASVAAAHKPSASPAMVEKAAEMQIASKTKYGAALRAAASRRSLKMGVLGGMALGLVDSTQKVAQIEAKVVRKVGVGYKALLGAAALIVGGVAGAIAEDSTTAKKFKNAEMISSASLNLADTCLTIEGYNLLVTRGSRVKVAFDQLTGAPAPEGVTGVRGVGRRAFKIAGRIARERIDFTDPDSVEQIADIFGIGEDAQEALFGAFDGDDDDDDGDEGDGGEVPVA